jgi:RimJ/RimL family protein N-acetyltransferase
VSVRLETERLVIRTFEHRDADAWIAMVSDPEVRRFLPPLFNAAWASRRSR